MKNSLYILVEAKDVRSGKKRTLAYENFDELKEKVVDILNGRGWDNKEKVDLRKVDSCLEYVLSGNLYSISYKFSTSYNKFMNYRYGIEAIV